MIGGKFSTDSNPTENLKENLIDDISLEYMLTKRDNIFIKLFRHTDYESILEGEVIETGVGFVIRKKLLKLSDLFRFMKNKADNQPSTENRDSVLKGSLEADSLTRLEEGSAELDIQTSDETVTQTGTYENSSALKPEEQATIKTEPTSPGDPTRKSSDNNPQPQRSVSNSPHTEGSSSNRNTSTVQSSEPLPQ